MKSFVRPSFFRVFDLLLSTSNPGLKRSRWTFDGVEFERERHTFSSPNHGLAVNIVTLTRPGRRGWKLMVTKEYWWAGNWAFAMRVNIRWLLCCAAAGGIGCVARQHRSDRRSTEMPDGFQVHSSRLCAEWPVVAPGL